MLDSRSGPALRARPAWRGQATISLAAEVPDIRKSLRRFRTLSNWENGGSGKSVSMIWVDWWSHTPLSDPDHGKTSSGATGNSLTARRNAGQAAVVVPKDLAAELNEESLV
jgi:hypothetical protein